MNQVDIAASKVGNICPKEVVENNNFLNTLNNNWEGSSLLFNISPKFLHVSFHNFNTNRSFNYVYTTNVFSNCKRTEEPITKVSCTTFNSSSEKALMAVNIYKDQCNCFKCLAQTFLLREKQPVQLRNELLKVFNSEVCQNWNENWLKLVMEQLLIILACIKDGIISERLIETACDFGLLLLKRVNTEMLENKYSLFSFHDYLWRMVMNYSVSKLPRNNKRKLVDLKIFCGNEIGSIYFDVVENFTVVSFETEQEMNNYTKYERKLIRSNPERLLKLFRRSIKRRKMSDSTEMSSDLAQSHESAVEGLENLKLEFISGNSALTDEKIQGNEISIENKQDCTDVELSTKTEMDEQVTEDFNDMNNYSHSSNWLSESPTANFGKITEVYGNYNEFYSTENSTTEQINTSGRSTEEQAEEFLSISGLDKIPILHRCGVHRSGKCSCKQFSLGMSLLIGHKRPMSIFVIDNLVALNGKDNLVTDRMANIAASALCTRDAYKTVRVIVVPVVIRSIVDAVNIECKSSGLSKPKEETIEVNQEVQLVNNKTAKCPSNVNKISTQKKSSGVVRELNKLSASLVEVDMVKDLVLGTHDYCCCNEDSTGENKQMLRIADGNTVRIADLNNRSRREVKLSRKFKESLLMDSWNYYREFNGVDKVVKSEAGRKRRQLAILQKCRESRRLGSKSLDDVYIWCTSHYKYSCLCLGVICRTKDNLVLWVPPKHHKYISGKVLAEVKLDEKSNTVFSPFDCENHCARTFGTTLKYLNRNRTEIFQEKRHYEIDNNILTLTNSYVKIRSPPMQQTDEIYKSTPYYVQTICLENVHITAASGEYQGIIFVDCDSEEAADHEVIILSDSDDEVTEESNTIKQIHSIASSCPEADRTPVEKTDDRDVNNQEIHYETVHDDPLTRYNREKFDPSLEYSLMKLEDHPLKECMYNEDRLPKLALFCLTPGIGYLPIVEYDQKKLVVQDPVYPEVLHSFRNLIAANLWINKFLKDFLVFQSIELSLKWIIVKPGIIKIKQSLPFSPAILESSSLIITKKGELMFSKNQYKHYENRKIDTILKRKISEDLVTIDFEHSSPSADRKILHLNKLPSNIGQHAQNSSVINLKFQTANSFSSITDTIGPEPDSAGDNQVIKRRKLTAAEEQNQSDFNANILNGDTLKTITFNSKKQYKVIPANLLIPVNIPEKLLRDNNITLKRI